MKGIDFIWSRLLKSQKGGTLNLEDDSLLESLVKSDPPQKTRWWEFPYIRGARLVVILTLTAMMFTLLVYYSITFIKDVLLYENHLIVNSEGAFTPHKALNCEYGLYLFNSSDVWANTGIQINEKDKIRINISGGYNTAVKRVIDAAANNTDSLFGWNYFHNTDVLAKEMEQEIAKQAKEKGPDSEKVRKLKLEKKDDEAARPFALSQEHAIGAALWAVFPEGEDIINNPLVRNQERKKALKEWQVEDGRAFRRAGHSGYLYLAVNDLYFDNDEVMEDFYRKNPHLVNTDSLDSYINKRQNRNSFDYDDNLGQILVAVEIQRHVLHAFFYPTLAYRNLEYNVDYLIERFNKASPWHFLMKVIGIALFGMGFGLHILFIFLLMSLIPTLLIYALFFLFHKLHLLPEAVHSFYLERWKNRKTETVD